MSKAGSSEIGAIIGKVIKVAGLFVIGLIVKKGKDKFNNRKS